MAADLANEMVQGVNRRMARGAAWMIGLRFVDRLIGLFSMIILARLLVPADFGLVAIAMAMVAVVDDLADFGFEMALIQNQEADRSHYDTAWTFNVIRGLAASVILALLAHPLALFFEDPRLNEVLLALSISPFLAGFYNIGTVAFRKDLTLNKEFIFRIVPRLIGVIATIVFALAWRNYWALVVGTLTGISVRLVLSYLMHGYRPHMSFSAFGDIMGFSKWMLMTSIADMVSQKAGTFTIAKILDAASLGIFSMSGQIANMASQELIAPIKQALFPGYAKLAHDIVLLKKAFLDVYGMLVLIALPAAIGIGLTAEFFVPLLLGPKWDEAIPVIEILVISGGLRSLSSHVRPVYLALNRPHLGAYASVGRAVVYLPALAFALVEYGIKGAAVAHAFGHVAVLIGSLYLMNRLLGITPGDIWRACWRSLTSCAVMVIAVGTVKLFPPLEKAGFVNISILLALSVLVGAATYASSLLLLWRMSGRPASCGESYFLAFLGKVFRKRRAQPDKTSSGMPN
jgi:lipopolysaccharide exporter